MAPLLLSGRSADIDKRRRRGVAANNGERAAGTELVPTGPFDFQDTVLDPAGRAGTRSGTLDGSSNVRGEPTALA
jgi:hypothetical protein